MLGKVADGDLTQRLNVSGKDEVAQMSTALNKTLESTAKEVQSWVYEKAAKDDDVLLEKMKASGSIQVNEANKDAFIAASKPVYEEFEKEVPGAKEIIDRAIALGKQ